MGNQNFMRYSMVNGERIEAQPGLSGQCPSCGSLTIAKCGELKVRHWAHKGNRKCDPWWENETEWHRTWKNCFPMDWQEIIHQDKNGERHIADVKTAQGWVLEFQHSFLKPEERRARNAFYEKLIWVVNGVRRMRDKTQFFKLLHEMNPISTNPHIRKVYLDECALLKEWSGIHCPVFIDFEEDDLWCLMPTNQNMWGYVVAFPRHEFIAFHNKGADQVQNFDDCLNKLNSFLNLILKQRLIQQERSALQASSFRRNFLRKQSFRL